MNQNVECEEGKDEDEIFAFQPQCLNAFLHGKAYK